MKILVFSDSHGSSRGILKAISAHADTQIEAIIHLGDGSEDMKIAREQYPNYAYINIAGNYEEFTTPYEEQKSLILQTTLNFGNKTFLLVHGHKQSVKSDLSRLTELAKQKNADITLYGHTHLPADIKTEGVHLFNPGTISLSYPQTYGVIQIANNTIITGTGKI
jgi:phosphoesterase, MJ0936 family